MEKLEQGKVKFSLYRAPSYSGSTGQFIEHTIETQHADLNTLLEAFEDFLKGCGYSLEGHLDIVNEDTDS